MGLRRLLTSPFPIDESGCGLQQDDLLMTGLINLLNIPELKEPSSHPPGPPLLLAPPVFRLLPL